MSETGKEIEITPIVAEQAEAYHKVVDSVARERKYLSFFEAPPVERAQEYVRNNIRMGFPHFVATAGSAVVGWCDVTPRWQPTQSHTGVLGMGLLRDYRGKGNGKALLGATLEAARDFGLVRIELEVNADNARAIAFYEGFGFEREGRLRHANCVDGIYEDILVMAHIFDAIRSEGTTN